MKIFGLGNNENYFPMEMENNSRFLFNSNRDIDLNTTLFQLNVRDLNIDKYKCKCKQLDRFAFCL